MASRWVGGGDRGAGTSGLLGAIWQLNDDLAVDDGPRSGRANGHAFDEVRPGLTFSFPIR